MFDRIWEFLRIKFHVGACAGAGTFQRALAAGLAQQAAQLEVPLCSPLLHPRNNNPVSGPGQMKAGARHRIKQDAQE